MNRFLKALSSRAVLPLAAALALPATAAAFEAPPVLDRELFFGNPEIATAQDRKSVV